MATLISTGLLEDNDTVLGYGYNVITSPYIQPSQIKTPIINMKKIPESCIIKRAATETHSVISFGEGIQETMKSFAAALKLETKYFIFTGGIEAEFDTSTLSMEKYVYARFCSTILKEKHMFRNDDYLRYMNTQFIDDINEQVDIDALFKKYGTHLIRSINLGGRFNFSFTYQMKRLEDKDRVKAKINIGFNDICKCTSKAEYTKETISLCKDSSIIISSIGGDVFEMSTPEYFSQNHNSWINTIKTGDPSKSVACDISDMSDLTPIWSFCQNKERANEIESRYFDLLYERRRTILPTEYLTQNMFVAMGTNRYEANIKCPSNMHMITKNIHRKMKDDFAYICFELPDEARNKSITIQDLIFVSSPRELQEYGKVTHNGITYYGHFIYCGRRKDNYLYIYAAHSDGRLYVSSIDVIYGNEQIPYGYQFMYRQNTNIKACLNEDVASENDRAYIIIKQCRPS